MHPASPRRVEISDAVPFGHPWGVVVHGRIGNTALLFRAFDWTRGSRERSFFSDGVAAVFELYGANVLTGDARLLRPA